MSFERLRGLCTCSIKSFERGFVDLKSLIVFLHLNSIVGVHSNKNWKYQVVEAVIVPCSLGWWRFASNCGECESRRPLEGGFEGRMK